MLSLKNNYTPVRGSHVVHGIGCSNESNFIKTLFVIISAIVANANSPEEIADFAFSKKSWIRKKIYKDFSCLDSNLLSLLLENIRPDILSEMFAKWLRLLGTRCDGRSSSLGEDSVVKSFIHATGFSGLDCVSISTSHSCLVLEKKWDAAQAAEDDNFVDGILHMFNLKNAVVFLDSFGITPEVASSIISNHGDYLVAIKKRKNKFYNDLVLIFNYGMVSHNIFDHSFSLYCDDKYETMLSFDIINDMFWVQESNIYRDAKSVIRVVSTRIENNRTRTESRYYVSSIELSPDSEGVFRNGFWMTPGDRSSRVDISIDHDCRDIPFNHASGSMAMLRKAALDSLGEGSSPGPSYDALRKKAAWDSEFLTGVLSGNGMR